MTGGVIEWTGPKRWNAVRGCTRENEACRNCYAEILAARFSAPGMWGHGFAEMVRDGDGKLLDHRWTGKVQLIEERLTDPLRWRTPQLCFANSTFDIFHPSLSDADIDRLFAVMALCRQHHFQLLTKRWNRMRDWFSADEGRRKGIRAAYDCMGYSQVWLPEWPLPNVSLGVSVHDQACADQAIPALLATPAALRFVSYEPALGPVDWSKLRPDGINFTLDALTGKGEHLLGMVGRTERLDLIIAGDESGAGKRPADPDWYRKTRDQCTAAGVPFFLKQMHVGGRLESAPELDGQRHTDLPQAWRALL